MKNLRKILALVLCLLTATLSFVPASADEPVLRAAAPSAPSITSSSSNQTSVTIRWSTVGGATGYQVRYGVANTAGWTTRSASGTSFTATGLAAGTTYTFQVRASYRSGGTTRYTDWSSKHRAATQALGTPSVSVSGTGTNSMTLRCSSVSGATGYQFRWGKTNTAGWDYASTSSTNCSVSGLKSGTRYTVQVRAYKYSGGTYSYGEWSSKQYATTRGVSAPSVPSGVYPTATGSNSIRVTWNADSRASGFEVRYGRKNTTEWTTKQASGNSITVSGLRSGTNYVVQVRAYWWQDGSKKYTDWSGKTYVTTPGPNPTPAPAGEPSITISGTAAPSQLTKGSAYDLRGMVRTDKGTITNITGRVTNSAGTTVQSGSVSPNKASQEIYNTNVNYNIKFNNLQAGTYNYTLTATVSYNGRTYSKTLVSRQFTVVERKGYWGEWSGWSKTSVSANSRRQVEVRYHWWAAKCNHCGCHNPYWGSDVRCKSCGQYLPSSNVTHVNVYTSQKNATQTILGRGSGTTVNGQNYWYCEAQYRYRDWIGN